MIAVASALALALVPPVPTITSGPAAGAQVTRSSATFVFGAPGDYLYECKIGGPTAPFGDCRSGTFTVTGLAVGTHTFSVRTAEGDDVSATVERTWTVTAIDDDGDGHAVPADCSDANPSIHPTASEVPGNGIDENCDGSDAPLVPVMPAAPSPTPTATPVPTAKPRIDVALTYFMNAGKRSTRFSSLSLRRVPAGATITVTCTGGCPRKRVTLSGKRGTVPLTAFRNRSIRAGAKLTIAVTKPGATGMAKVVTIRSGKRPAIATRTLR